ncbi:hypothetical protein [Pseudomonas kurunegalensis]|uniref:hypothetical protein n=1 Tax=Pseudomonas kurunegalensis TaxID=485880 RepID=UPI0040283D00
MTKFNDFFLSKELRKQRLYDILKRHEHRNSDIEQRIRAELINDLKYTDGIESIEKAVFKYQYRMGQVYVQIATSGYDD